MITFNGLQIVVKHDMVVQDGIDWSKVRSPSRALRRQKNRKRHGFPIKYKPDPTVIHLGNTLYMHPALLEALKLSAGHAINGVG